MKKLLVTGGSGYNLNVSCACVLCCGCDTIPDESAKEEADFTLNY